MLSDRKIAANRRNSRKSCGPRTAAGKEIASRNALRHGLAASPYRQCTSRSEIERFAQAICRGEKDSAVFAQAVKIAENEMELRAIGAQQVAAIERLREPYAVPFAKRDNSFELATARLMQAWLAYREITALLPKTLEKYQAQMLPLIESDKKLPDWIRDVDDIVPIRLKALLKESEEQNNECEVARTQIEERDEYEALEAAALDLIRLDRYERRTRSRQKRAVRNLMNLKLICAWERKRRQPLGSLKPFK